MSTVHTIKGESGKGLQIQATGIGVLISATLYGVRVGDMVAKPEQVRETILALSAALAECGGVRCHDGDACQSGQRACPTPWACGVK